MLICVLLLSAGSLNFEVFKWHRAGSEWVSHFTRNRLPDSYPRYPRKFFIIELDSRNALDIGALSFRGRFVSAEEPWQATAHFFVIFDIVVSLLLLYLVQKENTFMPRVDNKVKVFSKCIYLELCFGVALLPLHITCAPFYGSSSFFLTGKLT